MTKEKTMDAVKTLFLVGSIFATCLYFLKLMGVSACGSKFSG
jgi:hypothetical protein